MHCELVVLGFLAYLFAIGLGLGLVEVSRGWYHWALLIFMWPVIAPQAVGRAIVRAILS